MRFGCGTAALCTALLLLASTARADLYLGRMELYVSTVGGLWFPDAGAAPVIGTAPGGNAVGAPLVMGASDVFVGGRFRTTFPSTPPFLSFTTHASWGNGAGTLAANAGPGTTTFCGGGCIRTPPTPSAGTKPGWVRVSVPDGGSRRRFGGVQAVLGSFEAKMVYSSGTGHLTVPYRYDLSPVGGVVGGSAVVHTAAIHVPDGWTIPVTLTVTGMPWTTGRVSGRDFTGSYTDPFTVTGYDTTVSGMRNILLVSGMLMHSKIDATNDYVSPAYMALHLRFVPEPAATALLAAGLATLASIHRVRAGKHLRRLQP